ncbi:NUMOD4 motif [Mycobacteroides abscessus subsp. abscessus]|uniref:NUMOD4 domain-containing protein n=1 Tax=Mycobacteroides abscessus TaxID=36809 RepID=UPI00092898B4|nr:NUMOD4 domain-containing protein [Mycobacteroides abscessus]SHT00316.1 NUMOD4 motif [Mycobacteroides abscessus subsp. abscessus]SHT24449.1 NUMOD4 motif [Mycobacteroides abscessus subsp. abscessus]SHT62201.1 NUMOD4 motif [Mycobacteroides abscessus subsp. abscessus]SHX78015.1 NUMOD4 motif [Mycobacteroides abscessus subsp. abscessus]SIB42647.1 NUMOD4 motif [Mycobacteroides abscessus subsp. abscessus]
MSELWRPIDGRWNGFYEVSTRGRVRSVARVIVDANGHRRRMSGRLLKLSGGRSPHCTLTRPGLRQTYYPRAIGARSNKKGNR